MSINNLPFEGEISVSTQNIFPVIKKWLYSERDIFLRELISNACDAITKLRRLSSLGEISLGETSLGETSLGETSLGEESYSISVTLDKTSKTLTVSDNGIGMSEDEVREYLCNIALSGALKFIEKYENSEKSEGTGIIGHFGLGFYSAFMVAETVEVITKSYTDAPAARTVFRDDGKYSIAPDVRTERGTDVILRITDEAAEYLDEYKLRGIVERYCSFMPYPIFLKTEGGGSADDKSPEGTAKPVNDTEPLWDKNPSDVSDKEYNDLYAKLFGDYREPLFHVHIKADYPLNFRGILYFPRLRDGYDSYDGQVKLYYNRVFVADNIKEILPEYLIALRGVIDCPELPLNVSRSYLQNDAYAKKVAAHIAKKVTDRLTNLAANERETYAKIWREIKLFVEFGAVRDAKFYDRMKSAVLYERADGDGETTACAPLTLDEYFALRGEKNDGENADKTVYYATDKVGQAVQIAAFAAAKIPVVLLDRTFDTQFVETVESRGEGVKFLRIDAASDALKSSDAADWSDDGVKSAFAAAVPEGTEIVFSPLSDESVGVIIEQSEQARRMSDMMKMYRTDVGGVSDDKFKLIINSNSPSIRSLANAAPERREAAARMLYLLSLPSLRPLTADEWKTLGRAAGGLISGGLI